MTRVVIIGGGLGGLASAVRLAKLGHEVTLVERRDSLGGALGRVERDGYAWDSGPSTTLLPAVVRDLFRKSGRPLERELELVRVEPAARHVFADGVTLDLPAGSRSGQTAAVDAALGSGRGARWSAYVDGFADTWDVLRRSWLERPWSPDTADPAAVALLGSRRSLHRDARRRLKDQRLALMATHAARMDGHDPRGVPAWMGMWSYVARSFGTWTAAGGLAALTDALERRLATRGVTVLVGTDVTDLVVEGGRAVGVATTAGDLDADVVVCAVDPRRLPALARFAEPTQPAMPPVIAHLGVTGEVPDLPHEVVLHGEPLLVLRTGGRAPEGSHAWTLLGRGRLDEDPVISLARRGIRVHRQVAVRVDESPRTLVELWGGSPYGVLWQGRATLRERLSPRTPIPNVLIAGAHAGPGAGIPQVGLSAALVAQVVGPA